MDELVNIHSARRSAHNCTTFMAQAMAISGTNADAPPFKQNAVVISIFRANNTLLALIRLLATKKSP